MPRATKRWASRSVRRAQGAATVGKRSVKMRRGQARLRQNHLRTHSWRRTRYVAQGRSARCARSHYGCAGRGGAQRTGHAGLHRAHTQGDLGRAVIDLARLEAQHSRIG